MTAHEEPAARPAPGGPRPAWRQAAEVAVVAGRLGLTSFGGPTAHPAYFRREYVTSRGWIREEEFAETMALCQLLPGPSSSQLGVVIGGGHVVLPLLDASVGPLVEPEAFLAGYGMAQAMPGPLFTFSTYLGHLVGGPAVALLATFAIFLPGLLLAPGTLPFWAAVRHAPAAGGAVAGASAAVVGLLAATLVHPLLTETVIVWRTALLAAALFVAARWARPPVWMLLAGTLAASLLLG